MRKLAWVSGAFSAGVFICAYYVLHRSCIILYILLLLAAAASIAYPLRHSKKLLIAAEIALTAGLLYTLVYFSSSINAVSSLEDQTCEIRASVCDYSYISASYSRTEIKIINDNGREYKALLYDYENASVFEPGTEFSVEVKIKSAGNKYGETYDHYYSRNIYLICSAKGPAVISGHRSGIRYFPQILACKVKNILSELYSGTAFALIKSLMTGDKSDLYSSTAAYSDMQHAGLMHIVAVSGMHISYLVSMIQLFFGRGKKQSLICIIVIWIFTLACGNTASAVRASFMQTVLLMAPVFKRENDSVTSMLFSLGVILLFNPFASVGVSLQLSYGAMAGILVFSQRATDAAGRTTNIVKKYVIGVIGNTIGVSLITIPLVSLHFGYFTLLSFLTNIIVLWAVPLCFCGGYISAAFYIIFKPAGRLVAAAVSILAKFILKAAELTASIPYSVIFLDHIYLKLWIISAYAVIILSFIFRNKDEIKKLYIAALIAASFLISAHAARVKYDMPKACITAVDVGQGQCIIVHSNDKTVMIDCGNEYSLSDAGAIAEAYLRSRGILKVDMLALTHLHTDHVDGVPYLLHNIAVDTVVIPEEDYIENSNYDDIFNACIDNGSSLQILNDITLYKIGDISVCAYPPAPDSKDNDHCLGIYVSIGGYNMLVTGDMSSEAERMLISQLDVEGTELIVAGHHGSRYSCCGELLDKAGGEAVIISCGFNYYGHPTYETLARVNSYGYDILRTDLLGTVEIYIW